MKKCVFIFSLCLGLAAASFAQDGDNWQYSDGNFEGFSTGGQWYTSVTDANLRSGPSLTASVLGKLPIGTLVTVNEVSKDTFEQRGLRYPWLLVNCQVGGNTLKGYVWGGFMAMAHLQTPTDKYQPNAGVLYLTNLSAYNPQKNQITVQVRVAKDGKELAQTEFLTTGDPSYTPQFEVGFESLQGVKAVLTVNYSYPACGYPSGNNLVFWTNTALTRVLETSTVADGGVFYDSEEWILPNQRGGIGDHVLVVKDQSEFTEMGDDLVRTKQSYRITLYKWNGQKLMKLKEIR
jgi:hypothetical protein